MKKIVLAGNAITAKVFLAYLQWDPRYEVVGLTVDDIFIDTNGIDGYKTVGLSDAVTTFSPLNHKIIMAMGYNDLNRSREKMFERLKEMGYGIESYIHQDARVYSDQPIGEGSVLLPGAIIEPFACVGANAVVWTNVTLAHHSSIDDHCWVAAGAVISGHSKILRNSFLGVSSTVVNSVTVGEFNIVGANAMISRNTKPNSVHLARSGEPFRYSSDDYEKHFGI